MLTQLLHRFLGITIHLAETLFVARAILSWIPMTHSNPFVQFLYTITEPILVPFRTFLMRFRFLQSLPFDFSPLLVFILLDIIRSIMLLIL